MVKEEQVELQADQVKEVKEDQLVELQAGLELADKEAKGERVELQENLELAVE